MVFFCEKYGHTMILLTNVLVEAYEKEIKSSNNIIDITNIISSRVWEIRLDNT